MMSIKFATACLTVHLIGSAFASVKADLYDACINHRKNVQKAEITKDDQVMCECMASKINSDPSVDVAMLVL